MAQANADKWNYEEPLDITSSLENTANESVKDYASFIDQRIKTHNYYSKLADSKNQALIALTQEGLRQGIWFKEHLEAVAIDKAYLGAGEDSEVRRINAAGLDGAIELQNSNQNSAVEQYIKNNNTSTDEKKLLRSSLRKNQPDYIANNEFAKLIPAYMNRGINTLQYRSHQTGEFTTVMTASNAVELEQGLAAVRTVIIQDALGNGRNIHQLRKTIIPALRNYEKGIRAKWLQNQKTQYEASHNLNVNRDLAADIINMEGSGGFSTYLRNFKGKWTTVNPDGTSSTDWAGLRNEATNKVIEMIEDGTLPWEDGQKLVDGTITDHNGKEQKFSKYWEREANLIQAAVNIKRREETTLITDRHDNEVNSWWENEKASWGDEVISQEKLLEAQNRFYDKFGSGAEIPQGLKTAITSQEQESGSALLRLQQRVMAGERLSTEDVVMAGITDPNDYARAIQWVKTSQQTGRTTKQLSQDADWLDGAVRQFTGEVLTTQKNSPRHLIVQENLEGLYNSEYTNARAAGQSHIVARTKARDAVRLAIKTQKFDRPGDGTKDEVSIEQELRAEENIDVVRNLRKARVMINKDKEWYTKPTLLPGEEVALAQAANFHRTGQVADLYDKLAAQMPGIDKKQLQDIRLGLLGNKKKQEKKEESRWYGGLDNFNIYDRSSLTDYPNPSKSLQLYNKGDEFKSFFTDNTKNTQAEKNGAYDYLESNETGQAVELEKPLSQHTIGEVINLLSNDEYSSFGINRMSRSELKEALLGTSWDVNDLFNQEFQDELIEASMRKQANKGGDLRSSDIAFNALYNLDPTTRDEANNSLGLEGFNQLQYLNTDIAMALIRSVSNA